MSTKVSNRTSKIPSSAQMLVNNLNTVRNAKPELKLGQIDETKIGVYQPVRFVDPSFAQFFADPNLLKSVISMIKNESAIQESVKAGLVPIATYNYIKGVSIYAMQRWPEQLKQNF